MLIQMQCYIEDFCVGQYGHLVLILLDAAVGVHRLAGQQLKVGVAPILLLHLNAVKDPEVLPRVPAMCSLISWFARSSAAVHFHKGYITIGIRYL